MTITAKFPGTCRKCGQPFGAGAQINWVKGEGSEHVTCPTAKSKTVKPATAVPAAPKTSAPQPEVERLAARYAGTCAGCGVNILQGEQIEYHRSERAAYHLRCADKATEAAPITTTFTNKYQGDLPAPGYIFRSKRYSGKLLTIVRGTVRKVSQNEVDDQDDFRGGGDAFYELTAYCREATEAEFAPVIAREQVKAAKDAAQGRLEAIARQIRKADNHVTDYAAQFATVEGVESVSVKLNTITTLSVGGNGIWVYESTYDDSHFWRIDYDAALADEIRKLVAVLC